MTYKDFDNIILCGDVHGQYHELMERIQKYKIEDAHIIVLGDYGIGLRKFADEMLEVNRISDFLKKRGCIMSVLRGNHDDPFYFRANFHSFEKNVIFYPDYTILDTPVGRLLLWGGAISIDRKVSIETMKKKDCTIWWEDEKVTFDFNYLNGLRDIDYVLTHNAPKYAPPQNLSNIVYHYARNDETLIDELEAERAYLNQGFDMLKENNDIVAWYYGHFHHSKSAMVDGVEFNLLDILELKPIKLKDDESSN